MPNRVHMICQAHIDPVWIWDWPEGHTETLATFETALTLLDEYPEFVFNHNESMLYEWTKEHRPDLFDRIKEHVRRGRWVISGGWFLQPDLNLLSGESIARHILYGRRFFREEFGTEPKVAYNLDTFGHNPNIPQFLALSGYRMYTHFRPTPEQLELPDFLYVWRGVDGSEVVGFRPPCGWYCSHPGSLVADKIEQMRELAVKIGRPTTMFWGAGDHGGGATREDLEVIRTAEDGRTPILHSSFERYWEEVASRLASTLPVFEGELQKTFIGCYTSIITNKLRNRRGEGLLLAAERFAALAWWLLDEPYPTEALDGAWKDLLFMQFHDVLPGSSIREGAISAIDVTGRSATVAKEVLLAAQLKLLQSGAEKSPLTVRIFNPHPVARVVPAVVDLQLATHPDFVAGKYLGVYDASGREIARQLLGYRNSTGEWRNTFLFDAELVPMGLSEYVIRIEPPVVEAPREAGPDDPDSLLNVKPRELADFGCRVANRDVWYHVNDESISVDCGSYAATIARDSGALVALADRGTEMSYIAAPSFRLLVRSDSNSAWGGPHSSYGPIVGAFEAASDDELPEITGQYGDQVPGPAVRIVASGPLAVVTESLLVYKRSIARLRYTFYRNHPHIDVDLALNWNERRRALQMEIATALQGTDYEAEIPHAAVRRKRNGGEEPVGRWVMLESDGRSFALVNDGPGGAEVSDAAIRQTLVRSPVYCSGNEGVDPGYLADHMDLGEHRYRFRMLFGPTDKVVAERQLSADDLTLPFSYHTSVPLAASRRAGLVAGAGTLSMTKAGDGGNIHLETMKVSEDGAALILRWAERAGRKCDARVSIPGVDAPVELSFRPFEMKTLRIERNAAAGGPQWAECDLLERPLTG